MREKPLKNLKKLIIRINFLYLLLIFCACKIEKFNEYKVYIAPIVNKTSWVQLDTELFEYLHTFLNKFMHVENSVEDTDIQVYLTITQVQLVTPVSGRLDEPLFSEINVWGHIQLITKKTKYNFSIYESAPFVRGQEETIEYALERIYEKIGSRVYFSIARVIKNDKKV
ncbi:MAG: hypothetical protein ACK4NF_04175 [Planctomycetota bacterium]